MTVGELIALLCKQASDKDGCLMARSIYSIDIKDEEVYLSFVDANTEDYSIKVGRVESEDEVLSKQEVLRQLKGCLTGGESEYEYVKLHIDSIPPS